MDFFDFLENHPHVIKIYANETKTFYIHVIPSLFGSIEVYLSNKTSFGEVLGHINDHITTGNIILWFEKNFDKLNYSVFTSTNKEAATLNDIFRRMYTNEHSTDNLQNYKNSLPKYDNKNPLLNLDSLSQIHNILGEKHNWTPTIQLATLHNKLQAFKSVDTKEFVNVFKFYSDMSDQKKIHPDCIHNATLLTILFDIDTQDMMDISNQFQLFDSSPDGSLLTRALILQWIFMEIEKLNTYNPQKRLNVKRVLDHINYNYIQFDQTYTTYGSTSTEDFQKAYLAAMLKNEGKVSKEEIDNALFDIELIRELLAKDSQRISHDLLPIENTLNPQPHSVTITDDDNTYVNRLLVMSYTWGIPIKVLINSFRRILQNVENPGMALFLLKGIKLGYIPNDISRLFQSTNDFFRNEEINSMGMSHLFISGLFLDLKPEQVISLYKEASSRLRDKNINHTILSDFVDSTINLNARPYTEIILSNDGLIRAVKYDAKGNMQPATKLHVRDYLLLQFIHRM